MAAIWCWWHDDRLTAFVTQFLEGPVSVNEISQVAREVKQEKYPSSQIEAAKERHPNGWLGAVRASKAVYQAW